MPSTQILVKIYNRLCQDVIPEWVKLEDARNEDSESDHGNAHSVDDDALVDELCVLVPDRFHRYNRFTCERAGQLTAGAGMVMSLDI